MAGWCFQKWLVDECNEFLFPGTAIADAMELTEGEYVVYNSQAQKRPLPAVVRFVGTLAGKEVALGFACASVWFGFVGALGRSLQ